MKPELRLKDAKDILDGCLKCVCCTYSGSGWPEYHIICPLYTKDPSYTASLGGITYVARALLDGKLSYDDPAVAEIAYTCTACGACDKNCYVLGCNRIDVRPSDVVRLLRSELVRKGMVKNPEIYGVLARVVNGSGYLDEGPDIKLPAGLEDEQSNTVLFAECLHTASQKQQYQAAFSLLNKMGETVSAFSEKGCCGSSLYDLGLMDRLTSLVKANWEKMKGLRGREWLFLNPHCQEFVVKRYGEFLADYKPLKARHISQKLLTGFKAGRLKSKRLSALNVSYHDPCYLGRGLGIFAEPREVLAELKGVKLIEMGRNRANSFCCGARALGNYYPNMSEATAKERVQEFQETGADVLVTACQYCKDRFQKVMPAKEKERIKDLLELVDERT
jgi:Fe-S oxidoreductase